MTYYDTKQAAIDPDNPAANEQIPYTEWNVMVSDLRRKIYEIAVDITALGNDKVLVYKTASSSFVMESPSMVDALADLTDVTISGVPSDNEVLAYDSASSDWINQTAAEAGLATVTNLASYLALAGGTMTGDLNMGNQRLDDVNDLQAYDSSGVIVRDSAGLIGLQLGASGYAFTAYYDGNMSFHKLLNVLDPTSAQDASTKNYADTRIATKEIVTSFMDGYGLVYKTSSGMFEMEAPSASAGLPVADTTAIIKGSADGTKLVRFEADGLTTGTTRVMTVPDKNITLCGTDEVLLLNGTKSMAGPLNLNGNALSGITTLNLNPATELAIFGGEVFVTQKFHTIDTESDAASDDLRTISGATDGTELVIRAANSARTVVVKHGTGNIVLDGAADKTLDNEYDTLSLIYDNLRWLQTGFSNNGT